MGFINKNPVKKAVCKMPAHHEPEPREHGMKQPKHHEPKARKE